MNTTFLIVILALLVVFFQISKKKNVKTPQDAESAPGPDPTPGGVPSPSPPPPPPPKGPLPDEMVGTFSVDLGLAIFERRDRASGPWKTRTRQYPTLTVETKNVGTRAKASITVSNLPRKMTPISTGFLPISVIVDLFNDQQPPEITFDNVLPSDKNVFDTLETEYGILVMRKYDRAVQPTLTYYTNKKDNGKIAPKSPHKKGYAIKFMTYDPIKDKLLKGWGDIFNNIVMTGLKDDATVYGFHRHKPEWYEGSFGLEDPEIVHHFNKDSDWEVERTAAPLSMIKWPIKASTKWVNVQDRYVRSVAFPNGYEWEGKYGGKGGRQCKFWLHKETKNEKQYPNCDMTKYDFDCCSTRVHKDRKDGDRLEVKIRNHKGNAIRATALPYLCAGGGSRYFGGGDKECPDWWRLHYHDLDWGPQGADWRRKVAKGPPQYREAGDVVFVMNRTEEPLVFNK